MIKRRTILWEQRVDIHTCISTYLSLRMKYFDIAAFNLNQAMLTRDKAALMN